MNSATKYKQTVHFTYTQFSQTQSNKANSRLTFLSSSSSRAGSSSNGKSRHLNRIQPKQKVTLSQSRGRFESAYGQGSNKNAKKQQICNAIVHPHPYYNHGKAKIQVGGGETSEKQRWLPHQWMGRSAKEGRKTEIYSEGFRGLGQQTEQKGKDAEQIKSINSIDYASIKPIIGWNKYFNLCGMDHGDSIDGCNCHRPCKWAQSWTRCYQSKNKKPFQRLLLETPQSANTQQIQKDLPRTFPDCPTFSANPEFRNKLRRVLTVYSIYDREVGYVQGMNVVAAALLYHIKQDDQTFWALVELMDQQELRMIYLTGFKVLQVHIEKIKAMMNLKLRDLAIHMEEMDVTADVFLYGWLLSLMSNCIPLEYMHLVIEQFKTRGWVFIYQLIITYLAFVKEPLLLAQDSSQLLAQLNNDSAKDVGINWDQMIRNCYKVGTFN